MTTDKKFDDKPADKTPAILLGPNGARAVPVKQLRIPAGSGNVMELPGNAAAKTISDDGMIRNAAGEMVEAAPNKPRTKIWYLPWLGCYAVLSLRPDDGKLVPVGPMTMVPREWAQWIPLE